MRAYYIIAFALVMLISCSEKKAYGDPLIKPDAILKNPMSYLIYNDHYVTLWDDFVALDPSSAVMTKEAFLQKLTSGDYLPLRLNSFDSISYYQLYKLPDSAKNDFSLSIKRYAEIELEHFKMEDKTLPAFNFTDLKGAVFNRETTKGKIVVLKCWFIGCVPCVKEMPELNQLVKQYKKRDDILFVSLALDSSDQLKAFLAKKAFDYSVVPAQNDYITHGLKVNMFPTHLIVDREGQIAKVVNKYEHLEKALYKLAVKIK